MKHLNNAIPSIFVGLFSLITWEILCSIFSIPTYLLPKPSQIISDFFSNPILLLNHSLITLFEALAGFVFANIFAIGLSIFIIFVPKLDKAIMPFAIALKTTPIVAMAPLLLLWFGTGIAPKIAASALICFFPSLVNSLKGFRALHDDEEDLFRVYGASKLQLLLKIRFQRAAPFIFSALKVSSSLSIVGAIVGEFVGANEGIGYIILVSSYHLETIRMFSALFATSIAGVAFYALISYLDRKIVFWLPNQSEKIRLNSPPPTISTKGNVK